MTNLHVGKIAKDALFVQNSSHQYESNKSSKKSKHPTQPQSVNASSSNVADIDSGIKRFIQADSQYGMEKAGTSSKNILGTNQMYMKSFDSNTTKPAHRKRAERHDNNQNATPNITQNYNIPGEAVAVSKRNSQQPKSQNQNRRSKGADQFPPSALH